MKKRFANTLPGRDNGYQQKRVDTDYFNGYVALVKIKGIDEPWIIHDEDYTGCILDENYQWLEIYPDDEKYAISVALDDKSNVVEWYFDMIKDSGVENGIPYINDLYLDLVIRANGNQVVLDENELKDALDQKDITEKDFNMAYETLETIKDKYGKNLNDLINLTDKLYKMF